MPTYVIAAAAPAVVAGLLLMYLPERHAFGGLVVLMQDRGLRRYYSTDMSLLQVRACTRLRACEYLCVQLPSPCSSSNSAVRWVAVFVLPRRSHAATAANACKQMQA
jgi:hypothetical protein